MARTAPSWAWTWTAPWGREAVEVLRQTGRSQFSFVEQNLSEPDPLPGGPFDVVFARLLLVHLPNRLDVLRRMCEVTRPGGVVLVQDAYSASVSILPPPRTWGVIERIYPGIVTRPARTGASASHCRSNS